MRHSWIALLAALLLGCGGDGKQPLAGEVTLDGKPLEQGDILFLREPGGSAAGAGPVRAGKFRVALPPGEYKVAITAARAVGGATVPEMGNIPVLESIIPAEYNSATTLRATVEAGGGPVAFALRSKPPAGVRR